MIDRLNMKQYKLFDGQSPIPVSHFLQPGKASGRFFGRPLAFKKIVPERGGDTPGTSLNHQALEQHGGDTLINLPDGTTLLFFRRRASVVVEIYPIFMIFALKIH